MNTNHNRIKVSDLETNSPDKILITNSNGELEFSYIKDISYNALDYTLEGKALDARQGKILKGFIDNINTLLASDNADLNTIQELVDAIEVIQTSLNNILVNDLTTGGATKALSAEMGKVLQNNKVDKVTGKSLLSDSEIMRLGTLVNYTHPTTHAPSIIAQDTSNRFVSDTEKATWNAKQSALGFTPENIANKNAVNGYAGLGADGKIIGTQLPSVAIKNTFVVASQTAMLALIAETGDMAIRSDVNKSYILKGTNPALISDWQELLTPPDAVTTVFGRNGTVTSQTGDYTADQISETASRKFQNANQNAFNDATSSIQTQLNSKQANIAAGTTSQYFRGDKSWQTLDKTAVGLPNADNTADAVKNVLSATKLTTARTINGVAFDGSANITINATDSTARIASSEKGAPNGVATLDASGIILTSQLPSYVDDVLEFTNLAGFPATGESGKIYIAKDSNKTYRWGGSAYVYITSGAVDSVAGKTGVVTLTKADVGLGSVDNTADAAKNVLSATKLTTARTINGVSFDGSANITIADSTKENNITAGTTAQYWRGDKTWQALTTANVPESGNLYFSNARSIASVLTGYSSSAGTISATDTVLTAINKLNGNGDLKAPLASPTFTGTVTAPIFSGALTGNAATATILQTARTINGVSFNGSANITIADSTKLPLAGGTMSGDIVFPGTDRSEGIFGTYDSTKTQSIWSIGTAYRSSIDGSNFGTLYGLAYKHTNNTSGGTMAGGHQMVWCNNGSPKSAIGDGIWTAGTITGDGSGLTGISQSFSIGGNAATATKFQTPRTINGVSFDGSSNITIPTNDTDKVPHQDGTRSDLNYNSAVTASGFYNVNSTGTNGPGSSYNNLIVAKGIDTGLQIAGGHNNDSLCFRGWSSNGTTFTPWRRVLHDGNYNSYSPTLTGTGASGNWGINITGSAGGSSRLVDLLANRTDAAAYPILWGVNQGTNPITGNASTYAFSCDAVKIQSSTGTVIANNFSGNGTGLTGTAGSLNIGGNAETATSTRRISFTDGPRTLVDRLPNTYARTVNFDFVNSAVVGGTGNYGGVMTFAPWDGNTSSTGDSSYQLGFRNESGINGSGLPGLRLRKGIDTTWGGWYDILHSGNYAAFSAFTGAITGSSLTVSGDVTAFSDARVKENIRPISNVIERIQASRGVVYDRIDNDQKDNIGFIAQELEENFPELVLTREDGTKAVKYQNAVAVLFEAVKKQQAQIEQQDKKLKIILEHLKLKL
ncbi:MAG: tail fiber domain-containing protein [Flavobacterium sp.]|uniref:tail fiber domain-containing protein n=1 Tax=Flavobacterium sp. TaxID=239 RepID=UPI001AFE0D88|nr:tail fiber domain-containing protein [Flavobacterium sp.]MBO9586635.1 tail fiber domain-containing protein [Flavobacterium sp.]